MDGRICGKKIKAPLPDIATPAKRAKLDLPLSIAKVNSVTARLNISSTPGVMSGKPRRVSSTDSSLQKISNAFDFRFVASDDEVRQLLVATAGDKHRDVALISHPDDLLQANLVSRLSISEEGRHTLGSGKLFEGSQPLTLVMDIRKLSSEELSKFNDLLDPDNPCLYDKVSQEKRPLGQHVSLLVLADPAQLASVGRRDDVPGAGAPGADFWRRINRPENTWQFNAQTGHDPSMEIDKVPPLLAELPSAESAMDDDNTVLIDCHLHNNWRQLLLGGPGVNKQGRIQHLPGKLELLKAGQRVILKGADWEDLTFEQTIRQMLAQKCFESNGKVCQLPDDVQFYQMPVGNNELHSLLQSQSRSRYKEDDKGLDKNQAPGNPIIINQSNIAQWLNPIAVAPEGFAAPNTCLLEQIRAGGAVTVTSPLTEALWFRLLGSLQTIRETTGLEPRLQVAHAKGQPKALGLTENDKYPLPKPPEKVRNRAAFDTVTYQQSAQANHWINALPQAPLIIQVNEQTSFSQLFDNIHITSEQQAHFGQRKTALQEALTTGKPVVMRGLESNPTLQQLLEPLIIGQPLLVNGQLQAYPKARVTLLWPASAKSPSSMVNLMIAKGSPCLEVDLWDINVVRHGIPRTELPEQALYKLYEAFKTVPAQLCKPLPEITERLLNNLILAARRAQQVDQSLQLLPCHWRKAINSVITHGTRQNPTVRDFMKVACWQLLPDKHQAPTVDPDQLTAIINGSRRLDRRFVKQNLWRLTRAFDPAVLMENPFEGLQLSYESPLPGWAPKKVLDKVCALIVAHGPEAHRQAMAYQLAVDLQTAKHYLPLAIRPSRQIKRLQDALASGWQLILPSGQTRSDAIQALASDCFHIVRTANSEKEGIERIKHRLFESMAWQGSTDMPLSALARDLYHGEIGQKDRESRRLSRLHERLTDSPVIFLQGETGTGKSYFSAKMARASGQASVISLGPSDSEQTLMKRWQWHQQADGDRSMVQQNRALMEWANSKSDKDGEYITLVLDEANLAQTGLLASLNGLWEPKPCIYVNGHPVRVSEKHRVILTGNPDHYAGRQMDPALKEKLPRAYYPRLDQAFLRDRVVEPALVKHLQRHLPEQQINDIAHSATKSVMALWQYYQELLPDHEFTPRDLTDICSWVGWYLDRALPARGSVTCEQIHSLIQQSFRDVLGPEITETHQDALSALEIWFAARYHPNNTLSNKVYNHTLQEMQQTFRTVSEKIRPDFDTSGSAVRELVQQLGQDLNRCQQAYHLDRKHGGRQATLIEGPAGRGKDATLSLVIESVRQQAEQRQELMPEVFYLNACDCSWDKVCEKIQKAKVHGGIVVISEMNLIDSQHLEGELNDILAGDAHPGFHLFATINPPEYSGRKPLSPALKGRFRHLPIRQYNPAELQTIAEKVLPESPEWILVAKKLTEKHCRLRAYLQQRKLPLQPTSLDLQNVARAVFRGGDFTDKALHQYLNQHYQLFLMAAKLSLEKLPGSSALAVEKSEFNSGLCQWLNQTVSDIDRPWLIRSSHLSSVDEKNHEIRIKTHPAEEETKTELIRMVAQTRWQASGLSLNPDQSDDIFTQALYRHCQQCWFAGDFSLTEVDANSVFPLTKEQAQTLKMPAFQPYLQEADKQIQAWKARDVQCWPAFWHQISDLPNHWINDFINTASAISGDDAPEPYDPEVEEQKAPALDQRTNYEDEEMPKVEIYKIFDSQHSPEMYRWQARDIRVTARGEIKKINLDGKHLLGVETLTSDQLPGNDQEVILTRNQTLATLEISPKNGQCPLPSLTASDIIMALHIEPCLPFKVIRDDYTGLHTLFIPLAAAGQSFQCTYVVEPGKPGKKTAAKEAFFDVQCSEGMKSVLKELFDNINKQPAKIRAPLRKIIDAKNIRQRIRAITKYCKRFSGAAAPEEHENFFQFLVTQRQGSCRHRSPVFVAFCRYFSIPCREISSGIHSFAEYSVDGGQTWESVDLGGEPVEATETSPVYQTVRKDGDLSTELKKIKNLLEGADSAQQQALARACYMSFEELHKALETNSTFPQKNPSTATLVQNLWKQKDLAGFSMGVSILMETKALSSSEKELLGDVSDHYGNRHNLMSEAVTQILLDNSADQVIEQLKSLHSKMIVEGGASPLRWLDSMNKILRYSDLTIPSVIHFANAAMQSGWLDPLPFYDDKIIGADKHHDLLKRLEYVDELKVAATDCLKKWYQTLLHRGKNSKQWCHFYSDHQKDKRNASFITDCHDGFSKSLENNIPERSLKVRWTDQPGGVPNIERLLVRQPAFEQLISGRMNHRPVIIMGKILWRNTVINEKAEALLQRKAENNPELQTSSEKVKKYKAIELERDRALADLDKKQDQFESEEIEKKQLEIESSYQRILEPFKLSIKEKILLEKSEQKCKKAIYQAFSHYLYGVTHSNGGSLTYCWVKASLGYSCFTDSYGAHDPSSPEELCFMLSSINSQCADILFVEDDHLRLAQNANNALVLKPWELTKIADEFLNTVNLNSLYESLDT
ncbi:AAA family ATPase [Endozoicomonas sp. 8E]|uniref:AAA family ATPase n=1 Tax=Endozoicomonas sp. 8E TaxID=3035692 RepID=UPI0029393698|nr:AAA family ATPase [Endozoicomonas sp. 8E]WOG28839.1 AAA family ATPase [Endozoicomonas sp. 8E]